MKISSSNYSTQFKAHKVATTKNTIGKVVTNIDIYKLGREDASFLKKLADSIDFKKLFPKLNEYALDRWNNIFRYCISGALSNINTSYIAFSDNKPCGILTYYPDRNNLFLDGICSIPTQINQKVNLVGKTLFYQIFKDAQENNAKGIVLSAVNNGPFNVVNKYEELGFKKDPTTYPYTKMFCNKHKIADQLKELPFSIQYKTTKDEKINLNNLMN